MDEPGWSWPAWKFGMRKDDLSTKLHDQYNTFPSAIQDEEAFHHDVQEISNMASTAQEFHEMMADRKQQRLRELNDSLAAASVEIIANPRLIGTEQWQYALQLFRSRSLDSLIRYFASYLPNDHPWHRGTDTESTTSSDGVESLTNSATFFIDHDDKPILTHEPHAIPDIIDSHLPPSPPRSLTISSDGSAPVSIGERLDHAFMVHIPTPARTLSFSGSESEAFDKSIAASHSLVEDEEDTSQPSDPESPITSVSDVSEAGFMHVDESGYCVDSQTVITDAITPLDYSESTTPTPKPQQQPASSYLDLHRKSGACSPRAHSPNGGCSPACVDTRRLQRMRSRREGSPVLSRSTGEPLNRIQKPLPDPMRCRPRGRRRVEPTPVV